MSNLLKCPTPRNFKTGKVTLTASEKFDLESGFYRTLVIMKFNGDGEILFTKDISQDMIDSIEDRGEYFLMSYK